MLVQTDQRPRHTRAGQTSGIGEEGEMMVAATALTASAEINGAASSSSSTSPRMGSAVPSPVAQISLVVVGSGSYARIRARSGGMRGQFVSRRTHRVARYAGSRARSRATSTTTCVCSGNNLLKNEAGGSSTNTIARSREVHSEAAGQMEGSMGVCAGSGSRICAKWWSGIELKKRRQ
jgi:hypothetical protein